MTLLSGLMLLRAVDVCMKYRREFHYILSLGLKIEKWQYKHYSFFGLHKTSAQTTLAMKGMN